MTEVVYEVKLEQEMDVMVPMAERKTRRHTTYLWIQNTQWNMLNGYGIGIVGFNVPIDTL